MDDVGVWHYPGERPDSTISIAIQLYTGAGVTARPSGHPEAVMSYFGRDVGTQLLARIGVIFAEADASYQRHHFDSPSFDREMKSKYPELSDEARSAVRSFITFVWR